MLILFLNVVHYDINHLKADHVQPKTPWFTSDSQHPPRFGHAVYLGGFSFFLILIDLPDRFKILNKNIIIKSVASFQFYF